MTDVGGGGQDAGGSAAPANVAAIVDALDQRARQAGTEGATTVLRGMLGSVSEALSSIEHRLDSLEERLSGGGGDTALAEQVQSGLNAFNSRLGRLEEAFVQAVEDSGQGTQAVVDQVKQAVIASLPSPPAAPVIDPATQDVLLSASSGVARVEAAVGRVEEAILETARATSAKPADEVVAALAALSSHVTNLEEALAVAERRRDAAPPTPPPAPAPAEIDLGPILERLDRLEVAVSRPAPGPVPQPTPAPPVDLGPVLDRLDELAGQRPGSSQDAQLIALVEQRLGAGINAMVNRADTATKAVGELGDEVRGNAKALADLDAIVRGLRGAVARLEEAKPASDDNIEARLADIAGLAGALPQRLEEAVRARLEAQADRLAGIEQRFGVLARLGEDLDRLQVSVAVLADAPPPPPSAPAPAVEVVDHTEAIESVRAEVTALAGKLDALAEAVASAPELPAFPEIPPFPEFPTIPDPTERLTEVMRREAELLTQRVAALAVGVEATRSMLEQHVEETADSLGRKATDFTKRLAADFGIRPKRGSGWRRGDRREIGPGPGGK